MVLLWGVGSTVRAQNFVASTISTEVAGVWSAAAGDFDGDGDMDIAATGSDGGNNTINWLKKLSNGNYELHQLFGTTGQNRNLAVANFNADGYDDIVFAAYGEDHVYLLSGTGLDGANAFSSMTLNGAGGHPFDVCTDDVNLDGVPDVVVCEYLWNNIHVFVTENGVPVAAGAVNISGSSPHDVTTGDYDRDGDIDLIVGTNNRGVYWVEQVTLSTWSAHFLGIASSPAFVSAADFNLDGYLDIVVSDFLNNQVVLWRGQESGFSQTVLTSM